MKSCYKEKEMNVIVIGDAFVSPDTMEAAIRSSSIKIASVTKLFWGSEDKTIYTAMQQRVEKYGPDAEPWADGLEEAIVDADIIFHCYAPLSRTVLKKAKRLSAIFVCRGGTEQIDMEYCKENGITVETVVRNKTAVAEYVIAQMIDLTRNITASHMHLKNKNWVKYYPNDEYRKTLSDQKIGMAGFGNIGQELLEKLEVFSPEVIVYSRHMEEKTEGRVTFTRSLKKVFEEADLITLQLRECEETKNIISKEVLECMKPTACLINTARPGILDYDALYELLKEERIAGAALDVFPTEPFLEERYLTLSNVLLTPHIAGDTIDAIKNSPYQLIKKLEKQ